jgi:hypothetical protein
MTTLEYIRSQEKKAQTSKVIVSKIGIIGSSKNEYNLKPQDLIDNTSQE